ncbi:zinc finger CCCH-type with G patch domain-containing protein isoform X4 [Hydra vulgaris]|uniref:Zinc finger CCCH-type with G patch domain-containing protein isoform X4 n=1 Tax=Hydra vulgaris TaxID=6087 RepID=A0ABM4BDQ7_HYDVU
MDENFKVILDEDTLQESLASYKDQLAQIISVISTADDALTKLELYDLEKDLKELISVTEESLLSLKKEKNLFNKYEEYNFPVNTESHTVAESSQSESIDDDSNDTYDGDFVGLKCRVKYTQEWGGYEYHNALILNVEKDCNEDLKIRVLFLNPIQKSMLPCKYFMDDKCTFNQDCRYSHGYLVNLEDLVEYEEPDFSILSTGNKCLAKYEDDIWYKATVREVHDDQATVSFDAYDKEKTFILDFHSIFPTGSSSTESSDDESFEDLSDEPLTYKRVSMNGPMAEWEQHTRGIGSKLMMKMGYIFGKGLGKNGKGIVDPVEIRLLPAGKSLDYIAELREKGRIKDPTKKKSGKPICSNENSAFDVINNLTCIKGIEKLRDKATVKFGVEESYKFMKKNLSMKRSGDVRPKSTHIGVCLNVEMLKNNEKVSKLKKSLTKMKKSLARNPGETPLNRTIIQNIAITERQINELLNDEKQIEQKLNVKSQTKKLSIF